MEHYQLVNVTITNGITSNIITQHIVPCSENGLTEEEKAQFLSDYYQARLPLDSCGLDDGFYWREDDTAVAIEATDYQGNVSSNPTVYAKDSDYIVAMKKYASKLFLE